MNVTQGTQEPKKADTRETPLQPQKFFQGIWTGEGDKCIFGDSALPRCIWGPSLDTQPNRDIQNELGDGALDRAMIFSVEKERESRALLLRFPGFF